MEVNKILCLDDLFLWFDNNGYNYDYEKSDDFFHIFTFNSTYLRVGFDEDDDIDDIIKNTITTLNNFWADEEFGMIWDAERDTSPSILIKSLKADEKHFEQLAYGLSEFYEKS